MNTRLRITLIGLSIAAILNGCSTPIADLRKDTLPKQDKIAMLAEVGNAIEAAAQKTFTRASMVGLHKHDIASIYIEDTPVRMTWGYPTASKHMGIMQLVSVDSSLDVCYGVSNCSSLLTGGRNAVVVRIGFDAATDGEKGCYVRYLEPNQEPENYTHQNEMRYDITYVTNTC